MEEVLKTAGLGRSDASLKALSVPAPEQAQGAEQAREQGIDLLGEGGCSSR